MEIIDLNKKITIKNNKMLSKQKLEHYINQRLTYRQMQEKFGLSTGSISRAMKLYGLKTKNKFGGFTSKLNSADTRKIIELRKKGDTINEISKELKISKQTIYARLKRYYPEHTPTSLEKTSLGSVYSKLKKYHPKKYTKEEIGIMRDLKQRNYSYQMISDILGKRSNKIKKISTKESNNHKAEERLTEQNNQLTQFCPDCLVTTKWRSYPEIMHYTAIECLICGYTEWE